jgi:hypothetical protein
LKKERIDYIDVPVRDLDDTKMAQIMAHENMEEWGASADVELETVRAIVKGYADGRIKLPKPTDTHGGPLRYAPHFVTSGFPTSGNHHLYTAKTLGKFLGWKDWRVEATLDTLAATERETLRETATAALSTKQAQAVATQTRRVEQETGDKELARNVGEKLAEGMRVAAGRSLHDPRGKNANPVTIHNIRQKTDELVPPHKRKPVPSTKLVKLPPIEDYIADIAPKLGPLFPSDKWQERLEAIIKNAQHIEYRDAQPLIKSLRALAARATKYADRLEAALGV